MKHATERALPYGSVISRKYSPRGHQVSYTHALPHPKWYKRANHSILPQQHNWDGINVRIRRPFFSVGNLITPAEPLRATDCGPARPGMWQATGGYRRWQGTEKTTLDGFHTYLQEVKVDSLRVGASKIAPAHAIRAVPMAHGGGGIGGRYNRLTAQRYRGQSYSQLTDLQG